MTNQEVIYRYAELKSKATLTQEDRSELESIRVRLQRTERVNIPWGFEWIQEIHGAFHALLHRVEALEAEVDILRSQDDGGK